MKDFSNMVVREIDDLDQAFEPSSIYLIYGIVKSYNPFSIIISLKTKDMSLTADRPIPMVNPGTLARIYFQMHDDNTWLLIALTTVKAEEFKYLKKINKLEVEIHG